MVSKQSVVRNVRFARLEPFQISQRWPLLRHALEETLTSPKASPQAYVNILAELQSGKMQAWAVLSRREKNPVLVGLMFTQICRNPTFGTSALYIVAAKGYNFLSDSVYVEGMQVLERFARENGCQTIEAITELPRIRRLLDRAGWSNKTIHSKEIS